MADHSRIDDLRRRVQKDPASIAFAQLAEECRRAREYQEAVDICRAGLDIHPGYLSARVTLGRALVELGELAAAQTEFSRVLESAPENLAAIRGLAEIHHRSGRLAEALAQYRAALLLARNDPDLEETIADLSRRIEPAKPAETGGLTLEHMQDELLKLAPAPARPQAPQSTPGPQPPESTHDSQPPESPERLSGPESRQSPARLDGPEAPDVAAIAADGADGPAPAQQEAWSPDSASMAADVAITAAPEAGDTLTPPADDRATRTVAALGQWLDAIHAARAARPS